MKIYTVYSNPEELNIENKFIFVPDEFNWWAFLFPLGIIWGINKKCWLFVALNIALVFLYSSSFAGISSTDIMINITKLPVQIALGLFANDFLRHKCTRQGFVFEGVICGNDETEAFRNWLQKA